MSDLSCNNCGKDAELGYCRECDEGTNDYCADLRKQVKRAQAWAAAWKTKAKKMRDNLRWVTAERDFYRASIYEERANVRATGKQRDAAQALVATHQATIDERDQRIAELEADLNRMRDAKIAWNKHAHEQDQRIAELEALRADRDGRLAILAYHVDALVNTAGESTGIAGYHLNGKLLEWGDVDELPILRNFLQWARETYGEHVTTVAPDHLGLCTDPLPFEEVPAPVNPDAPADLSMRGGIEYVKADPAKFIDNWMITREGNVITAIMEAFEVDYVQAQDWLNMYLLTNKRQQND